MVRLVFGTMLYTSVLSAQTVTLTAPPTPSLLAAITDRGRQLAAYDAAAWRATDAAVPYLAPADSDGVQHWGGGIPLETIRFAGANRLVLRCRYNGKQRSLEPYSLRRSGPGNLLLYAHEIESDQTKRFTVAKIEQLTVSDQVFSARYQVEFTATGALKNVDSRVDACDHRPLDVAREACIAARRTGVRLSMPCVSPRVSPSHARCNAPPASSRDW